MKIDYILKEQITKEDFEKTADLHIEEFDVKEDPSQIQQEDVSFEEFKNNKTEEECIVKDDKKVIGSTYCFSTSRELMNSFLENKITERELILESRKNKSFEAIYACSFILLEEYRRNGIMFEAGKKCISRLLNSSKKKPTLFAWAFSKSGSNISKKLAKEFNLEYLEKAH